MPFGLDFLHDSENQVNLFFSRCSRSSFCAFTGVLPVKRVQRYDFFRNRQNFMHLFFSFSGIFFQLLTKVKPKTADHLIIYYMAGMLISDKRFAFPTIHSTFAQYF